ncbi:MAG: ATP-binding cassette domain-containing protein [Candidatus Electryoneaceae bacterium]|nr:ATP-binding cassette domain-containing protein [Candidatus Electryoneaceae bacterium]
MSLIRINSLAMDFGGQEVLNSINTQVNAGDHIGLVGPNGAGKTTLLRLIVGELESVGGHIARLPGLGIGYLPQQPNYPPGQTVYKEVFSGLGELNQIEEEMNRCETALQQTETDDEAQLQKLAQKYADLVDRFEMLGGSVSQARISTMLEGLGVPHRLWHSPMASLSGGERNIIGLARILIGKHNLMLLDEPGNHLDFSGLEWLENMLRSSDKAFIIVSHNRYLLDKVCNHIWELERNKIKLYTGNYSEYRQEKLTQQLRQQAAYNRAQKDIAR